MLGDHERKALHEIQRGCWSKTPTFAVSFDTNANHLHRVGRFGQVAYTISLVPSTGRRRPGRTGRRRWYKLEHTLLIPPCMA